MLITIVRWWNIDDSHGCDAVLTEVTLSCCQSTVKSTPCSWHSFLTFLIMTNPWEKIINKFDRLWKPPLFVWWDQWITDEAWVDYILQYGNLSHCTNREFNQAFQNSEVYKIILSSEAKNDVGIYFHKKYVNKCAHCTPTWKRRYCFSKAIGCKNWKICSQGLMLPVARLCTAAVQCIGYQKMPSRWSYTVKKVPSAIERRGSTENKWLPMERKIRLTKEAEKRRWSWQEEVGITTFARFWRIGNSVCSKGVG